MDELPRNLAPRVGLRGASLGGSSSSLSPASPGEPAPSSPAASTSLTAVPGAPFRGWAQAIRGSSGSRSSSSSSSRLPPPVAARRPGSEDSAMTSVSAFRADTGSEKQGARAWPRHRGGPEPLEPVEATSHAGWSAPRPPRGCPAPPLAATHLTPPRACAERALAAVGGAGRGLGVGLLPASSTRKLRGVEVGGPCCSYWSAGVKV